LTVFVACHGLELDRLQIPPFEVGPGGILALDWPLFLGEPVQKVLLGALSGLNNLRGVEVFEKASVADPFSMALGKTLASQLCAMVSPSFPLLLREMVLQYGNLYEQKLEELPLTPRLMVSLFKACQQSKFIVTWLSGLDPHGENQIMSAIQKFADFDFGFLLFRFPRFGAKVISTVSLERLR